MAAVIQLPYQLGAVPSGFKPTASPSSISKLGEEVLFPAGPSYLGHVRRQANGRSFADDDKAEEERLAAITGVDSDINGTDNDIGEEEEDAELLARDPKEWKVGATLLARVVRINTLTVRTQSCRAKITTPCLVFPASATMPHKIKSRLLVRKRPDSAQTLHLC